MNFEYQISDKVTLQWVLDKMPQFLFPDLSKKKDRIQKVMTGVVATLNKKPVGLLLSTDDDTGNNYRIHSFLVHPEFRNKGLGNALVEQLEDYLVKKGTAQLDLYYRSHWKSGSFLEQILKRRGWDDPKEDLIIVRGDAAKVNILFMHDRLVLPDEYAIERFRDISANDRDYIKKKKSNENWYLDYLDPFVQENTICESASLVLRKNGRIMGWVISHLIAPDLNEVTALFIDAGNRPYKLAHLLMREAITRQQAAGITRFLITSKTDNYVMSRFLLRHAKETEVFLTRSLYSRKSLI
ncbi:MAG: GNAT family N-acetyltransferase [Saprospiraceae bacterium]|nr:GNAT family N-acetyltransferase [Saprospiraceae bacterium]